MAFPVRLRQYRKKNIQPEQAPVVEGIFDLVMCFGTFDIFHPGHEFYLSYAAKLARNMIVVIARDTRVLDRKKAAALHDELARQKVVAKHFPEARVILGDVDDIFAPIRRERPDILAFGYDQYFPEAELRAFFPDVQIVHVPAFEPKKWKSSLLKKKHEKK